MFAARAAVEAEEVVQAAKAAADNEKAATGGELERELKQTKMAQKPMIREEVYEL